jgi:hypothetical protein
MKKPILILVLALIGLSGASQTLIQPSQVRVTTNQFPMMTGAGVTNLEQAIWWLNANWHTTGGYVSTNVWTNAVSITVTNYGPTTNILKFVDGVLKQ